MNHESMTTNFWVFNVMKTYCFTLKQSWLWSFYIPQTKLNQSLVFAKIRWRIAFKISHFPTLKVNSLCLKSTCNWFFLKMCPIFEYSLPFQFHATIANRKLDTGKQYCSILGKFIIKTIQQFGMCKNLLLTVKYRTKMVVYYHCALHTIK